MLFPISIPANIHWKKSFFLSRQFPKIIKDWLVDDGSLTKRVITKRCCGKKFSVRVIRQNIANPSSAEKKVLKLQYRQWALIREVNLYCDDVPQIFARTVIPLTTLTGKEVSLAKLGNKPLGAYLFSRPDMQREVIQSSYFHKDQNQFWARRSIFYLKHKPLLVYEVFLPEMTRELLSSC